MLASFSNVCVTGIHEVQADSTYYGDHSIPIFIGATFHPLEPTDIQDPYTACCKSWDTRESL